MKKFFKIALLAIFGFVVVMGFVYLYNKSNKPAGVYETQTPTRDNIVKKTVATGNVVPRKEIEIKPQVSGIIDKLYVEAGDEVRVGDLIAKVRIIPDMTALNSAESRVNTARIALDAARLIYERNKQVFEQGVSSVNDFQTYSTKYQNAQEEYDAALSNLEIVKEGASKRMGGETNTLIRSTITGMILDVPVEEGTRVIESNTMNDGTTVATVAYMGEMIFKGEVDESEVGKMKTGMQLDMTIGAIPGHTFHACLEHIAPKGTETNGAIKFQIKALVELDTACFIRASYSANADIVLDRRDSVMVIPESLISFDSNGKDAFVEVETATPQQFERRDIRLGLSDGIKVEVLAGLSLDDRIKVNNE